MFSTWAQIRLSMRKYHMLWCMYLGNQILTNSWLTCENVWWFALLYKKAECTTPVQMGLENWTPVCVIFCIHIPMQPLIAMRGGVELEDFRCKQTKQTNEQKKHPTKYTCLASSSTMCLQFLFQLQQNHIFAKVNVGQRMTKISEPSDTWWGRSWMQSRNAMFGQEMLLYWAKGKGSRSINQKTKSFKGRRNAKVSMCGLL